MSTAKTHHSPLTLLALAAVAGAGCSSSLRAVDRSTTDLHKLEPVVLTGKAPLAPGERMEFRVKIRSLTGGELTFDTTAGPTADSVRLRSVMKTAGLVSLFKKDTLEINMELERGTAGLLRNTIDHQQGDGSHHTITTVRPGLAELLYTEPPAKQKRVRQELNKGQPLYNLEGLLQRLRGWMDQPEKRAVVSVLPEYYMWRIELRKKGTAILKTPLGQRRAQLIEGVAWKTTRHLASVRGAKAHRLRIWVSTDRMHLPLRISASTEYGLATVELVSYRRGRGSHEPPRMSQPPVQRGSLPESRVGKYLRDFRQRLRREL